MGKGKANMRCGQPISKFTPVIDIRGKNDTSLRTLWRLNKRVTKLQRRLPVFLKLIKNPRLYTYR